MSTFDLSKLAPPNVVQPLDFEAELAALKAMVLGDLPELADVIDLESEPINKVLQVIAYQRVNMQARINDAARACMLAYAMGTDLDHLAALLAVQRLEGEDDERLRLRAQMAMEGTTVAGSSGSYHFHALGADPKVRDTAVDSPTPGQVRVTILSTDGDGTASAELLEKVRKALNAEDVRPLTDTVVTQSAEVLTYTVDATLVVYPGPGEDAVLQAAQAAMQQYTSEGGKLGYDVTLSALFARLHQEGVQKVVLNSPAADIVVQPTQAAYCTDMQIRLGGTNV